MKKEPVCHHIYRIPLPCYNKSHNTKTRYLTQKKKKQVIVYGVQNAFSAQLKAAATQYIEYPYPAELTRRYYHMILQNFDYISGKNINPTFLKTVEAVADHNQIPQDTVRAALQEMLDKGYVYQKEVPIAFNRKIKIVCANWEQLIKDGLWDPDA